MVIVTLFDLVDFDEDNLHKMTQHPDESEVDQAMTYPNPLGDHLDLYQDSLIYEVVSDEVEGVKVTQRHG